MALSTGDDGVPNPRVRSRTWSIGAAIFAFPAAFAVFMGIVNLSDDWLFGNRRAAGIAWLLHASGYLGACVYLYRTGRGAHRIVPAVGIAIVVLDFVVVGALTLTTPAAKFPFG